MPSSPCVLVVADPGRFAELATALADPFPQGPVNVLVSTGGDDTIDLFESRAPRVVVLTASLEVGDAKSLIETLRDMVPREQLSIVLIGDDAGPIRNALDAIDFKPDRFVSRPLAAKALRFAVSSGLEMVARALGESVAPAVGERETSDAGGPAATAGADAAPPAVARTPTSPLRGATPSAGVPTIGADPGGAAATIAQAASDASTNGARIGTGPVADHDPDRSGPPTERGMAVGRSPTDRGIGIASATPGLQLDEEPDASDHNKRAALRARWEALADSIGDDDLDDDELEKRAGGDDDRSGAHGVVAHGLDALGAELDGDETLRDDVLGAALNEADFSGLSDEAAPLPPPIEIGPRRKGSTNPDFQPVPPITPWRPGTTSEMREEPELSSPPREPTLILHGDELPPPPNGGSANTNVGSSPGGLMSSGAPVTASGLTAQDTAATGSGVGGMSVGGGAAANANAGSSSGGSLGEPARAPERWSHPVLLSELIDRSRDSSRELLANVTGVGEDLDELDAIDDDIIVGHPQHTPPPHILRGGKLEALEDLVEPEMPPEVAPSRPSAEPAPQAPERPGGRDFARQLRAKMSMMAQRLFQSGSSDSASQASVDLGPRHDHHTEIDLAALGEEPAALAEGVTQIESRSRGAADARELTATSPGSWDTQVREKGLPDSGEIVRGVSDAAMVLARMFMQSFTGRVGFRKDDVEKVAYFDQGRPVFASSNEPGDRMGELLVREGKVTASQYERCQVHVVESGRRMGEILVDFGYLKRRELLPAVRRHVEDIIYSLFGWDRGHYHITADVAPSAERIRLSRHPASLILEGVRRKLDRTTLEKVIGPSSTVIEIPDRERVNTVINAGDMAPEERAALAAFDGQVDLAQVARVAGVDVADVLPLAWGLVVLGLAAARRAEADPMEESTALVGETDLAIDRDRVRARWQLVTDADYFALLGVRRDATAFEIRRAYQSARRDFASDCFPGDLRRELARELEDIASVLDEAFRVLRDDRLRETYLSNLIE